MKKFLLVVLCLCFFASTAAARERVLLGVERLGEPVAQELLAGKRVGLFTNQTGVDSNLRSSVDLVQARYKLTGIFVPEHGLFGAVAAGETFAGSSYKNVPVHSLYGDTKRPTKAMLADIDTMLVDIQDVGIRHYTYFSSLAYIMQECAKEHKQVVVLDRPNPLGGAMQGPVLKAGNESFIGLYQLPLRHGLTIGEFARFINAEQKINCDLAVVPMQGWKRNMLWQDTKLPWVLTSPLIPTQETALLYGVTGCIGDSNLSVGVGTAKPFYFVGAPFVQAEVLQQKLNDAHISGVLFRAAAFTPRYGAYNGELTQGVEVYVTDERKVNVAELQFALYKALVELYPEQVNSPEREYGAKGFKQDIAWGEDSLRLCAEQDDEALFARWRAECAEFALKVKPYLLYK